MVTAEGNRRGRGARPGSGPSSGSDTSSRSARARMSRPAGLASGPAVASNRPTLPAVGPGRSGSSMRTGRGWLRITASGTVPAELVRLTILLAVAALVIGLLLPALVELAERSPLA